jgi:hypothetical protein
MCSSNEIPARYLPPPCTYNAGQVGIAANLLTVCDFSFVHPV